MLSQFKVEGLVFLYSFQAFTP